MSGVQDINYRIPDKWDAAWFARFIREVLANADVRNAIPGTGISITGTPDTPATISSGIDVQQLIDQPYILAVPSTPAGFLTHERVLVDDPDGVIIVTDGGANSNLSLSIVGIPYSKLPIQPALSILGNAFNAVDDASPIEGTVEFAVPHIEDIGASTLEIRFSTIDHEYISDFEEAAQDFVGNILVDTATIDLTYNDGTPSITADVINDSITDLKLRNSAGLSVIGRSASSTGDPADIVAAADGNVLRRSGTTIGFGDIVLAASNFANPTGTIGLTAVNGSLFTSPRSDSAPALSQAILPTWTGNHLWTDNTEVKLGTGGDLRLYHDGTDSFIRNDTGRTVFNIGAVEAWYLDTNDGTSGITSAYRLRSSPGITIPSDILTTDCSVYIARNKQQSIGLISAGSAISVGYRFYTAGGTIASPSAVTVAGVSFMSFLGAGGYDGTTWQIGTSGLFGIKPGGTWSGTSRPTKLTFEVTDISSTARTVRATLDTNGQFQFSDGTVSLPGVSFINDTDCGVYRIGTNNVGVAVAGAKVLDISATGLLVVGTTLSGSGTVSLPGFAFSADTDCGMYRIGTDNIGLAVAGAKVLDVSATGLGVVGTVLGSDGTVSLPEYSFTSDTDTGIYRSGANAGRGAANAADSFGWDNSTTATQTRFLIYDVDNATLERVTVGAADSGGTGFKVLRIPN